MRIKINPENLSLASIMFMAASTSVSGFGPYLGLDNDESLSVALVILTSVLGILSGMSSVIMYWSYSQYAKKGKLFQINKSSFPLLTSMACLMLFVGGLGVTGIIFRITMLLVVLAMGSILVGLFYHEKSSD